MELKKKRVAMAAAAAAGLLVVGGGWAMVSHKTSEPEAKADAPVKKLDAPHEKAFLIAELKRNPKHTPILLRLAGIERGEGHLAAARKYLEGGDPRQVDVQLELGLICWEMGDSRAAVEHNQAVLKMDARQGDALYNLGAISANQGDVKQAREFWMEAVRSGRGAEAANKSRRAIEKIDATSRNLMR